MMLRKACLLLIIIFFVIPISVQAENSHGKNSGISVKGASWEIDSNKNFVTITKDIWVKNDQFTLTCDNLLLYYLDSKESTDDDSMENRISKLTAIGNVTINHVNGYQSNAGRAEYDKNSQELILTENPNMHFGKNIVTGCRIIYFLEDDRIIVEGCEKEGAIGTIYTK